MFVLLVASSDSMETIQDIVGLTSILSERGHKIIIFFNNESINILKNYREDLTELPVGTRIKACRTTANKYGLNKKSDFIIGIEMSSLGELVDLMDEADRTVFL